MKFKVGDKVRFNSGFDVGLGTVVAVDKQGMRYLAHSDDITWGHSGGSHENDIYLQDNRNNWWFRETQLKLVEEINHNKYVSFEELLEKISTAKSELSFDEVDMVNEPLHYNLGEIQTLDYIDDVLIHNPNLNALDGYYLGNIIKYLSTRLGTKADKIQDMQKAQFYLNRRIKIEEESE